jgi:hypothetical protein
LLPVTIAYVDTWAYKNEDTEASYVTNYYIVAAANSGEEDSFNFQISDNSTDAAVVCNTTMTYDIPSDYNSELDEQYDQWLNGGNNSDNQDDNPEL